jgi:hypothetical protein
MYASISLWSTRHDKKQILKLFVLGGEAAP